LALLVRTFVAAVLLVGAALKLWAPRATADALATYDVPAPLRLTLSLTIAGMELAIAAALVAGAPSAPYVGAALLATFAAATARAVTKGQAGAPCGCFGPRSRVGWSGLARDAALAAALLTVPFLPESYPSTEGWLALGLGLAFVCILVLGVAVLALTRELGLLHLRLPRDLALDIADEGPPLGSRIDAQVTGAPLTLAIFSSHGCRLCRALEPVVAAFTSQPGLALTVFDEVVHADVWDRLRIPGSPYAVAIDESGAVRAKGTFNSYGQLEAIVAAAYA
jgi:methylamine utilization protein MauE